MNMIPPPKKYDAIVIGAGIGGLVCGCYLAKKGFKILLVERKSKVGGFCTSVNIKNFTFDNYVHSLGDLSPDGNFFKILNELDVFDELNFIRHNPIDKIISSHCEVVFYASIDETIKNIGYFFPTEKDNFVRFLDFVLEVDTKKIVSKLLNKTYSNILDNFFENHHLKRILSLPVFANVGVPAKDLNAFTAIKHYKSFLINGGYYPKDGIQDLPDKLLRRYKQYGGDFINSNYVKNILLEDSKAKGVRLRDDCVYESKYVISACDAKYTFFDLLGENNFNERIFKKLSKMTPSLSLFIIYIGLKNNYKALFENNCNCWYLYDYLYDENYPFDVENNLQVKWLMALQDPVKKTCLVFTSAPYATQDFWAHNKNKFMTLVLGKLEEESPGINSALELKSCVTPQSLENWTKSSFGAPYGWAATVNQFMDSDFTRDGVIKNLFLSGHWNTIASGVSGVAAVGKRSAEIIMQQRIKEFK